MSRTTTPHTTVHLVRRPLYTWDLEPAVVQENQHLDTTETQIVLTTTEVLATASGAPQERTTCWSVDRELQKVTRRVTAGDTTSVVSWLRTDGRVVGAPLEVPAVLAREINRLLGPPRSIQELIPLLGELLAGPWAGGQHDLNMLNKTTGQLADMAGVSTLPQLAAALFDQPRDRDAHRVPRPLVRALGSLSLRQTHLLHVLSRHGGMTPDELVHAAALMLAGPSGQPWPQCGELAELLQAMTAQSAYRISRQIVRTLDPEHATGGNTLEVIDQLRTRYQALRDECERQGVSWNDLLPAEVKKLTELTDHLKRQQINLMANQLVQHDMTAAGLAPDEPVARTHLERVRRDETTASERWWAAEALPALQHQISQVRHQLEQERIERHERLRSCLLAEGRRQIEELLEQVQSLDTWPAGWTIELAEDPQDLDRWGATLKHCIGDGTYDRAVREGSQVFPGFFDAEHELVACASIHVPENPSSHAALSQLSGERNHLPATLEPIRTWLKKHLPAITYEGVRARTSGPEEPEG